jgi:hypothetical protein
MILLGAKRLLALWNARPGIERRRKSATELLADPEPQSDAKHASKQEAVITMLRRPEGAMVDDAVSATGWQRHTVRGVYSGTLKKKLGLTLPCQRRARAGRPSPRLWLERSCRRDG